MRTIKVILEKADDQVVIATWRELNPVTNKVETSTITFDPRIKDDSDALINAIKRSFLELDTVD